MDDLTTCALEHAIQLLAIAPNAMRVAVLAHGVDPLYIVQTMDGSAFCVGSVEEDTVSHPKPDAILLHSTDGLFTHRMQCFALWQARCRAQCISLR